MKSILVVDDEFDLLEAIQSVLESDGFEVRTAGDGKEGLQSIKQQAPDLALIDVMMPVMNGLELLSAIQSDPQLKKIPVVMMSAVHPRWPQAEYGWKAFLHKPFDLDVLFDTIRSHIGE